MTQKHGGTQKAAEAPGLNGQPPSTLAISQLVAAYGDFNNELLAAVVRGWDIDSGVAAGRKFLDAEYGG